MKHKLPDEVMPTLYLTREEELAVADESNEVVRDTIDAFEAFVANKRAFPSDQWKRVKSKEGFDVFRTRQSAYRHYSSSSSDIGVTTASQRSSSSSSGDIAMLEHLITTDPMPASQVKSPTMAAMLQFPVVVLNGIVPGTVEDAAFGTLASTEAIWRLRSTYLNERNHDGKILATLKRPSKEDPFHFLGVKWAWLKLPAFVQERDIVYSENVGVLRDADGKVTMGYNLMHSTELAGVPELSQYDILRLKVSVCYLSRPHDDKSIEIYCRAFCIPVGNVPMSVRAKIYADALLTSVNITDCSHMKKLMWLTRQRRRLSEQQQPRRPDLDAVTRCQGCERALKRFGGLNRSTSVCRCCMRIVCGKCSSERRIVLDVADDGGVTRRPLPFCVQCVVEARALPAEQIAIATAVDSYSDQMQ